MYKNLLRPCASSRAVPVDLRVRRSQHLFQPLHATLLHAALLGAVLGATAAGTVQAAETPSLPALLAQAQARAPQLLELAANRRAAAFDADQARAWNNPVLSATMENLGGPKPDGASQREDTYTITQVFETGGKRAARIEAEQFKSAAVGARERHVQVQFANELALAYATAEAMQLRGQVADDELTRARDDLRASEALVQAGREAPLRAAQARASAAAAEAAVQSAAADTVDALERLSALAGSSEPYTHIDHPFLAAATTPAPASADWDVAQAPAVAAASAERDALAAQLRLEEKRWMPDIGVSVGVRKYAWSSQNAATIGISASIPLFDRNQSGIRAAQERSAGAAQRIEAARLETLGRHRAAAAQVLASERRLAAAEQGEAAANQAYRLGRTGYDAGKTTLTELLAIRRALSEAIALTIEARLARVRAIATLSLAEGRIAFGVTP
jgi:cobalt-zinc-cadmium efflux system outer membrane protein